MLRESGTGLAGRALRCSYPDGLTARDGAVYCQDLAVSAVIEFTGTPTPRDVYRCFKAGRLALYNGPLAPLLGDKRNLALLAQHGESDLFDAEERRLIADHVPWSRSLTEEHTTWHGERVRLLGFARAHRQSLVLKPAGGYSGIDVHIGSVTEPERRRRLLEEAAGNATASSASTWRPRRVAVAGSNRSVGLLRSVGVRARGMIPRACRRASRRRGSAR